MQHSPITHLDPEQFFTYILDCCHDKEAAGEDPFHFDEMPCVVILSNASGDGVSTHPEPKAQPITPYKHGEYWPTFANYYFKSLIKTEALTIYPEETLDYSILTREKCEECKRLLRNIDPTTYPDHFIIIAHTYTCQRCGQKVTDIIFTNTEIYDSKLFC